MKSSSDMKPPPAKRQRIQNYDRRPRLSICPSVSPDPDLVQDRDRNDNTLKGKFEAIFEKYGKDFSEIGDEINIATGEVVVDRGHILSMVDEKDPGSLSRARPRVSREPTEVPAMMPMPRVERALTVGALDVIASIEAMARRAVTEQTPYQVDDEEEEKEINEMYEIEAMEAAEAGDTYDTGDAIPYRSGSVSSDSLLGTARDDYQDDWGRQRTGSPDSLLGYEEQDSSIESFYDEHALPLLPFSASGSFEKPIVLTSEPVSAPEPDLAAFAAVQANLHNSTSISPPSPPPFVKSNGQKKVILKKINVSRAYEELQRQASSTPAMTQPVVAMKSVVRDKSADLTSRKAPLVGKSQEAMQEGSAKRNVKTILKRLPIPRPSSEDPVEDYESDDPLQ